MSGHFFVFRSDDPDGTATGITAIEAAFAVGTKKPGADDAPGFFCDWQD